MRRSKSRCHAEELAGAETASDITRTNRVSGRRGSDVSSVKRRLVSTPSGLRLPFYTIYSACLSVCFV